jgi:hypothetical protein
LLFRCANALAKKCASVATVRRRRYDEILASSAYARALGVQLIVYAEHIKEADSLCVGVSFGGFAWSPHTVMGQTDESREMIHTT